MTRKYRVIELFSGVGAQRMALNRLAEKHPELEFEFVAQCDIDKYAVKSYNAIHGETMNLGDISKVECLPDADIVTWSFPCFTRDTLVRTVEGWKEIADVKENEVVETHNGWKVVKAARCTGTKSVLTVIPSNGLPIKCTPNHLFYARKKYHVWNNDRRSYDRMFSEPVWIEAEKLTKDYYVGYPVDVKDTFIPKWEGYTQIQSNGRIYQYHDLDNYMESESFWYTIGRYIADGWTKKGGIVIAIGKGKEEDIDKMVDLPKTCSKEGPVTKVHISRTELREFCRQFGEGAENKHIPEKFMHLPLNLAKAMLDGYLDGDGSTNGNFIKCSSISKKLILDLQRLIGRIYQRPSTIWVAKVRDEVFIEGRRVYTKDCYCLSFHIDHRTQDKLIYENGWVWGNIRKVINQNECELVYDLEVEDAHSFIANGIAVHNCTDLSMAGKKEGMCEGSGTRSALCWEVVRLLRDARERDCCPEWLLMENVPAILFKANKPEFDRLCMALEELGYRNRYQVLNATDFDVAQNRKRCFMISHYNGAVPEFPKPVGLNHRLKDYLQPENEVDEKYYLSPERLKGLILSTEKERERGNGFAFEPMPLDTDKPSKTITTRDRKINTFIQYPERERERERERTAELQDI